MVSTVSAIYQHGWLSLHKGWMLHVSTHWGGVYAYTYTYTCQYMCILGSPCYDLVPQIRQVIVWSSNDPVQWSVNRSHGLNILLLNNWQRRPFNTHYCDLLMFFLPIHVLWMYFSENWSKTWLFSFRKTPLNMWVSKCPAILSGSQYVYIVVTRMTQL